MQIGINVNGTDKKEVYKAAVQLMDAAGVNHILVVQDEDSIMVSQKMESMNTFASILVHMVWAACDGDRDRVVEILAKMTTKAMEMPEPKGETI